MTDKFLFYNINGRRGGGGWYSYLIDFNLVYFLLVRLGGALVKFRNALLKSSFHRNLNRAQQILEKYSMTNTVLFLRMKNPDVAESSLYAGARK